MNSNGSIHLVPAGQGQAPEAADYSHVKTKIIPPTGVVGIVNPGGIIEEPHDQ